MPTEVLIFADDKIIKQIPSDKLVGSREGVTQNEF